MGILKSLPNANCRTVLHNYGEQQTGLYSAPPLIKMRILFPHPLYLGQPYDLL